MLLVPLLTDRDDTETEDGHELGRRGHHRYKVVDHLGNENTVAAESTDLTSLTFQSHDASLL